MPGNVWAAFCDKEFGNFCDLLIGVIHVWDDKGSYLNNYTTLVEELNIIEDRLKTPPKNAPVGFITESLQVNIESRYPLYKFCSCFRTHISITHVHALDVFWSSGSCYRSPILMTDGRLIICKSYEFYTFFDAVINNVFPVHVL